LKEREVSELLEQAKMYRISLSIIITFMTSGIIFSFLLLLNIKEVFSHIDFSHIITFIIGLLFSFFLIGYSFNLLKKRKQGKAFYWDDEGVVIDLEGNKVYWEEIEEIKLVKSKSGKSTVIYPHYTNHEKIRIRRGKSFPTPAHSIDWILIEKAKEYHKNLIKVWEEKNNAQKLD
jgi:hypothetical protein